MTEARQPSSLGRNTMVMAIGTMLSRLTGFGRIFALGYAIDFSRLTDTYNIANNVPNIVYELIVGGVLAATLVPVFVQQMRRNKTAEDLWKSISAVATITVAALTVLSVLVWLAAPLIIHIYTMGNETAAVDGQREVATFLLRLFVPQIIFYGFISIATGVLHAHRRFGAPMFAPILNNLVVIGVLLALPTVSKNLSLEAMVNDTRALVFLGLGTTAGVVAMSLVLFPFLHRISQGRLKWNWDPKDDAVRSIIRLSGWTLGLVFANQIAFWVTTALSNGDPDAFTSFLAAYTFFILPHGIFAVSVMSAVQPGLAEQWLNDDKGPFGRQLVTGLRLVMFVIVPSALGYMLLAAPVVSVALDHGAFSADSAARTSGLLIWLAAGLPAFSAFLYMIRVLQAMTDARTVFLLYVFENGVNVATAVPLWNAMGVNGLALSHSLAYLAGSIAAGIVLQKRSRAIPPKPLISGLWRICAAGAVMSLGVFGVLEITGNYPLLELTTAIITGTVIYLGMTKLLKLDEMNSVIRRVRSLTGGNKS